MYNLYFQNKNDRKKGIYCNECDYLLNKGKSTNFCQIHGKSNFKTTIPKRMAMLC